MDLHMRRDLNGSVRSDIRLLNTNLGGPVRKRVHLR